MGGVEESNSIWRGQGICKRIKSQEPTERYSLSGAKGFGFLRYHPVPLKGQRVQFITLKLSIITAQRIIQV